MKRIGIIVGVVAALASSGLARASSEPPTAPVDPFIAWAAEQGHPVSQAACWTEETSVVCYGLAEDAASVVVGFGTIDDGVVTFAASPAVLSATDPTGADLGAAPATSFGPGTWIVGVDIAPGTYHSDGPIDGDRACSWTRLSRIGTDRDEVVTTDLTDEPVTVDIAADDIAFYGSQSCGTWTMVPE